MTEERKEEIQEAKKKGKDVTVIAEKTLYGDLLKILVQELKHLPDAWSKLTEIKQQQTIDRITTQVERSVREVVNIVAAKGSPGMPATIESVAFKDGIKVTIKADRADKLRHELADRTGQQIVLVMANPDQFLGGDVPKAEKDQKSLPIEGAGLKH